ncbi:MAG: exodeoxyribonuclease VII small subunit [Muribaculaceae bacterium]|nr:exodeoxyribonuclease VII small subunit [Muribaculaceae bacterium]MDE5969504.1 exodeoxyribonuclease VII small subunit [Muribaculaceae bacterium]MDE6642897.1 exodeoxyribonuclease VII small subunit [Muribaculaceae bacterium]
MMKAPDKLTYTEAISELKQILEEMQSENCDIDRLTKMTTRAASLIEECRRRLTATDAELQQILDRLTNV